MIARMTRLFKWITILFLNIYSTLIIERVSRWKITKIRIRDRGSTWNDIDVSTSSKNLRLVGICFCYYSAKRTFSSRMCVYIYTQTPVFPLISNSLRTENFSYIINKQILDDTKYFPLPFPRENFLKKLPQDRFLKRIITRMKKKKKKLCLLCTF